MKPRWLRHMTPTPSRGPIPILTSEWASALLRRCSRSQLRAPRSSTIASSCGWWIAAVATPVAGEAPQRRKVVPIFSALSGRIGSRIPASRRTFPWKVRSEIEPRTLAALRRVVAIPSGRLFGFDACHRDAGDPLAAADEAHALVAGGLDADPGRGRLGECPLHQRLVGAEPGLLADQGGVDVDDRPGDRADDGAQEVDRVGVLEGRIVVGEHLADVAAAVGAEQGVDHRVGEDVGVGVALEPQVVLDLDAAEDQPATGGEAVAVVAEADHGQRTLSPRGARVRWRCSKTHISPIPSSSMNRTARSYSNPTCSGRWASEERAKETPASTHSSANRRDG